MSAGVIIGTVIGVVVLFVIIAMIVLQRNSMSDTGPSAQVSRLKTHEHELSILEKPSPDPIIVDVSKTTDELIEVLMKDLEGTPDERLNNLFTKFFQTFFFKDEEDKVKIAIDEWVDAKYSAPEEMSFINKIKNDTKNIIITSGMISASLKDAYTNYFLYYVGNALLKANQNQDISSRIDLMESIDNRKITNEIDWIRERKTSILGCLLFDLLYILVPREDGPFEKSIRSPLKGGRKTKPKKRK
jgi:hypothetical protein